jgi:hypothetical protein
VVHDLVVKISASILLFSPSIFAPLFRGARGWLQCFYFAFTRRVRSRFNLDYDRVIPYTRTLSMAGHYPRPPVNRCVPCEIGSPLQIFAVLKTPGASGGDLRLQDAVALLLRQNSSRKKRKEFNDCCKKEILFCKSLLFSCR